MNASLIRAEHWGIPVQVSICERDYFYTELDTRMLVFRAMELFNGAEVCG